MCTFPPGRVHWRLRAINSILAGPRHSFSAVHCSNDENAYSPDAIGTKSSRSGRSERTRSHGGDNKEPSNAALGYIMTARQVDASVRKITGTGGQRAAQNKQINRYRRWLTREILWSFLFPRSWNNKFDSASIAVCLQIRFLQHFKMQPGQYDSAVFVSRSPAACVWETMCVWHSMPLARGEKINATGWR